MPNESQNKLKPKTASGQAVLQPMRRIACPEFGELNTTVFQNRHWFCVTDVCRNLNLLLKEGEEIISRNNHDVREFLFKRRKITMSYYFVDTNGLLSLIIESRKLKANAYRMWIQSEMHEAFEQTIKLVAPPNTNQPLKLPLPKSCKKLEDYPTLDEYFTDFIPALEFCNVIMRINMSCLNAARTMPRSTAQQEIARRDLMSDVNIMHTFYDTLKANFVN